MKKYVTPKILWQTLRSEDVITASPSQLFGNEGSDGDNAMDWWEA